MNLPRIFFFFLFLSASTVAISGCSSAPLDKAFKGELAGTENNKVIYDYCQGCHVHSDFIPEPHVLEATALYKSKEFRETKECRTCHYIKKNFWGDESRKTIRPKTGKTKKKGS